MLMCHSLKMFEKNCYNLIGSWFSIFYLFLKIIKTIISKLNKTHCHWWCFKKKKKKKNSLPDNLTCNLISNNSILYSLFSVDHSIFHIEFKTAANLNESCSNKIRSRRKKPFSSLPLTMFGLNNAKSTVTAYMKLF